MLFRSSYEAEIRELEDLRQVGVSTPSPHVRRLLAFGNGCSVPVPPPGTLPSHPPQCHSSFQCWESQGETQALHRSGEACSLVWEISG